MRDPGSKRGGSRRRMEPELAPLIDVVFNLVIFFLLIPSFRAERGFLPTNLPSTEGPPPTPLTEESRIRIDLLRVEPWNEETKDDVMIRLNQERIADNEELRRRLRQARRRLEGRLGDEKLMKFPVLIAPDMVVWHKHVVAAFDAAIDTGFANIQFAVPGGGRTR